MTGPRADEHRPLLLASPKAARDVTITILDDDDYTDDVFRTGGSMGRASASTTSVFRYTSFRGTSTSLAAVSPTYYSQQAHQAPCSPLLSCKYVTYQVEDVVGQKRSRTKVAAASTMYGTMPTKPSDDECGADGDDEDSEDDKHMKKKISTLRSLLCKMDDPRKSKNFSGDPSCNSNQSETESDSDGSCGSNPASNNSSMSSMSSSSSLQSILRIRDGIYACRKVKKQVSVEFSLDASHNEKDDAEEQRKVAASRGMLCGSSCMPRRLTIEEKAALYRIRPDLQLTPMPLILRELEEIRRRRQRKLMFSILGGTLILLMIIVFYYLLTETP